MTNYPLYLIFFLHIFKCLTNSIFTQKILMGPKQIKKTSPNLDTIKIFAKSK
jgi:hypothetical protein